MGREEDGERGKGSAQGTMERAKEEERRQGSGLLPLLLSTARFLFF